MTRRRFLSFCAVGLLSIASTLPVQASERLTREQMREAHQKGRIKSLRWVLRRLHPHYPGRVLDVDLVQKNGRYIYKIRLLMADGFVTKLMVDANTAEVLSEKSRRAHRRK